MIVGATIRHDWGTFGYYFKLTTAEMFMQHLCNVLKSKMYETIEEFLEGYQTGVNICGLQPHKYDVYIDVRNKLVYFWENGQWLEFTIPALREYLNRKDKTDGAGDS